MKWTMTTVSYRYHLYSFNDLASIASRCGFKAIELWEPHFDRNKQEIDRYVEQGSNPLPIDICSAYQDLTDFSATGENWASEILSRIQNNRRLGITVLRLFTGSLPSSAANPGEWHRWTKRLDYIEEICQQNNVDVVFETHPGTLLDSFVSTERFIHAIVDHGWKKIGINFDVFHVWEFGVDVVESLKRWYPYIKHVHLKNARCRTDQFKFTNVYHPMGRYSDVCRLYDGVADIQGVVNCLLEYGYKGNATLEHFSKPSSELFQQELIQLQKTINTFSLETA